MPTTTDVLPDGSTRITCTNDDGTVLWTSVQRVDDVIAEQPVTVDPDALTGHIDAVGKATTVKALAAAVAAALDTLNPAT